MGTCSHVHKHIPQLKIVKANVKEDVRLTVSAAVQRAAKCSPASCHHRKQKHTSSLPQNLLLASSNSLHELEKRWVSTANCGLLVLLIPITRANERSRDHVRRSVSGELEPGALARGTRHFSAVCIVLIVVCAGSWSHVPWLRYRGQRPTFKQQFPSSSVLWHMVFPGPSYPWSQQSL